MDISHRLLNLSNQHREYADVPLDLSCRLELLHVHPVAVRPCHTSLIGASDRSGVSHIHPRRSRCDKLVKEGEKEIRTYSWEHNCLVNCRDCSIVCGENRWDQETDLYRTQY